MQIKESLLAIILANQILCNDAFMTVPSQRQHSRTLLYSSSNGKDNHRARVEKNLEEMMGRDWRMFRARLVAQEAAEERERQSRQQQQGKHGHGSSQVTDAKQAKQEKFGNLFAAIFQNKENEDNAALFQGNGIGGATSESMIPANCEDPFVSKDEIPVLLQSKVHVDKHRWAHALTHIEPGCVLIANEKLGGVFHQTVVLIIEHNDVTGSTGIVINRYVFCFMCISVAAWKITVYSAKIPFMNTINSQP